MIMDTFDKFADVLDEATFTAMRTWWNDYAVEHVDPSMVAAADDAFVLSIEAILTVASQWEAVYESDVEPVVKALAAVRVAETLADSDIIDLSALTTTQTTKMINTLESMRDALSFIAERGIDISNVEYVVALPNWDNYIDAYAATRRNLVVGMPETVYRDLVTQLSAASRDGFDIWERTKLVREFLSWEDEGGYDQWLTRAQRISRTETNGLLNSADLHAWKTEAAEIDDEVEMHKVFVATLDPRTRDTHFAADGQRVPLDGKFNLGGYEIDHPGDQSLPAHESINCRCTMMRVRADEDVPDDTDRQTERERIHKGRDVPARDPQAEVRSRARRGVTRDGDNDDDQPLIASGDNTMTRTQWSGILAPINKPTGDGRIFDNDAELSFREFPLPLMFQRATSDGHNTAVVVGKISDATIESDGVHATGEFFDSEDAREAAELVAEGVMRPSVDLTDMIVEHELIDADGNSINIEDDDIDFEDIANEIMHVRAATIMAATLVSKPAFAEAKIVLGEQTAVPADDERQQEENALLASAATLVETVDRTMFSDPQLDAPTALTMTDDGRVFGHLALWGTEHIARPGTTPPRSRTDYAMFHTSSVATDDGPISVGRLTVGTGHADARANSRVTAAHYDNTGATWALVRAGEDGHGIWVSGIVDPGATEAQIREGLSAPLSGDWRNVGGNLELVAALSVNTPGFPVPRSYAVDNGREMSLVASGVVRRASKSDQLAHAVAEGLRLHDERRARIDAERDRQRSARVMAAQMLAKGL